MFSSEWHEFINFLQVLAFVFTEPVRVVFASGMSSTASIDPGTWLRSSIDATIDLLC